MEEMTYEDWVEMYRPTLVGEDPESASLDGTMYEVYGIGAEKVMLAPANNIWTVVDAPKSEVEGEEGDWNDEGWEENRDEPDNVWLIVPGFHVVNRLGHVITEVPWEREDLIVVYD
jgi:hypothetical protein